MSRKVRCLRAVLAAVGFLACVPAILPVARTKAQGGPETQKQPSGSAARDDTASDLLPSLRADAVLTGKLDAARDYLKRESWAEGFQVLQSILDRGGDALVGVPRSGEDTTHPFWTGIRTEAARLLATLPAAGSAFYDATYGAEARALLSEARQKGNPHLLAEVIRRYPQTTTYRQSARITPAAIDA